MATIQLYGTLPGGTANLQDKSVTITENTTTNIIADSGYDGLGTVSVTTNVSGGGDTNTCNIKLVSAVYDMYVIDDEDIGSAHSHIEEIRELLKMYWGDSSFYSAPLTYFKGIYVDAYTGELSLESCFEYCLNLEYFGGEVVFEEDDGQYGGISNIKDMFKNCPKLTDESLNNILKFCIDITDYYSGTKTLSNMGLTTAQIERCESLSNYQNFLAAGWTAID